MAMSSGDFLEARKVSLTALSAEGVIEEKEKEKSDSLDMEVVDAEKEKEYYPTNHLLAVRHVAYSAMEEEERLTVKEEEEKPKTLHEKLYAQAIEGKEATEREKKEALLDHRG